MIHEAPEGYHYTIEEFNKTYDRVWLNHHYPYTFSADPVKTVWGFIKRKTGAIHAPINSKRVGKETTKDLTTPYTAMPLLKTCLETPPL